MGREKKNIKQKSEKRKQGKERKEFAIQNTKTKEDKVRSVIITTSPPVLLCKLWQQQQKPSSAMASPNGLVKQVH